MFRNMKPYWCKTDMAPAPFTANPLENTAPCPRRRALPMPFTMRSGYKSRHYPSTRRRSTPRSRRTRMQRETTRPSTSPFIEVMLVAPRLCPKTRVKKFPRFQLSFGAGQLDEGFQVCHVESNGKGVDIVV